MDEPSVDKRLAELDRRIDDIRKSAGISLGQNALTNLTAELKRLEAERAEIADLAGRSSGPD